MPVPPALSALDPVLGDPPPPRGSSRYESILERAMSATTVPETEASTPRRSSRRRRATALVGVAAAAVLIIVLILVNPFGKVAPASATDRITAAAVKTAKVTTYRVHGEYEESGTTVDGDVDGADFRIVYTGRDKWTNKRSTTIDTLIGDRQWETTDGKTTERPADPPENRNAPFQQASSAVVRAALHGSTITEVGQEQVRGVAATHYRLVLTPTSVAALSALAPNELSAFELEYPDDVRSLDLWVADDLIRRVHVAGKSKSYPVPGTPGKLQALDSTVEFYDFGAHITITPPR
jgi:hypothetical protein